MENFKKNIETQVEYKRSKIKPILLSLGLILGASHFSYSQGNTGRTSNRIEYINSVGERNIETYRTRVKNRNNNIKNTSENLDDFTNRLGGQFEFEVRQNTNISNKIREIKNLLNSKYSQSTTSDDPLLILQTALKNVANMEKYQGLTEYTGNFSGNFDINFINAIGYIQFINNLSDNGTLIGENGKSTLNMIISDLDNKGYGSQQELVNSHRQTSPTQKNNTSQVEPVRNNAIQTRPEINRSNINTRVNKISSDYSTKVENRNENIQHSTNETLEDFATRMNRQFLVEYNNPNSLISKKIGNIKNILNNKFNQRINSEDPVIILQLALKELSNTEKYKGLNEYINRFSGKYDINFVNAYGFIQYVNDRNCNWILCGTDGALILQSIYEDLNNIESINSNITDINISQDSDNSINTAPSDDEGDVDNEIPDIEPDNRNLEGITLLSNNLSSDRLNGVTYEDVRNTINGFRHEGLKNAVMNCLLHNDVVGAQRLLGMDINCNSSRYPNYVASTRIGQRELKLMENLGESRRYMDTQEILDFMTRLENAYEIDNYEVKTTYLKFLSGELNNNGLPYSIISKYDYKIYLFSADHKLLACQPVLTGAHIGDHANDPMHGYHTTPGGMYEIRGIFDKSSEGKSLVSVYGTDYLLLFPQEGQYVYSKEYTMGIHGYVLGRGRRLLSENTRDHRVSNGCVNMDRDTFGEIINHLKFGSKVYVCKDDEE